MKHSISNEGFLYRLRPIELSDAQSIIDIRLEDKERNKFIHSISPDIKMQEKWLTDYFEREEDYYFMVENKFTNRAEGLISIYNISDRRGEWGRYVIKKDSFAAVESALMCFEIAFEVLNLDEIFGGIIAENTPVINLHKSYGAVMTNTVQNTYEIGNQFYDMIEMTITKNNYFEKTKPKLEKISKSIYDRFIAEQS